MSWRDNAEPRPWVVFPTPRSHLLMSMFADGSTPVSVLCGDGATLTRLVTVRVTD